MRMLPVVVLLALTACSGISVSHDWDRQADFSGLKTYAWHTPPAGPALIDSLTSQRIVRAVDAELARRGYRKAESGAPDFLVHTIASVNQRIEATPTTMTMGYGYRGGHVGYTTGTEIRTYDEGTLVLDLIAPATKSLLWRGTAKAAVRANNTPEEREARIQEAVALILEPFPPGK